MISALQSESSFDAIQEKSFVDVPGSVPSVRFPLAKVGITNRPHYIYIRDPFTSEPTRLLSELNVFFALPANQRGVHMSRIEECLHDMSSERCLKLNAWVPQLSERLLSKQELNECIVELSIQYEKPIAKNPSQMVSLELIKLYTTVVANENGVRVCNGVAVPFINACPCTQRWAMREFYLELISQGYDRAQAEDLVRKAPLQAHTNLGTASLRLWSEAVAHRSIYDLLDKSVPIVCELLKGPDEHALVRRSHQEGQFCEDNARAIVNAVVKEFDGVIAESTVVEISTEVQESVHFHNLYAEVVSTFSTLKQELKNSGSANYAP